jgi:hypothetical protein
MVYSYITLEQFLCQVIHTCYNLDQLKKLEQVKVLLLIKCMGRTGSFMKKELTRIGTNKANLVNGYQEFSTNPL